MSILQPRFAVAVALIVALAVPFVGNAYQLYVVNLFFIFALLTIALNILLGYTGLLAFSNVALFGIGAYVTGIAKIDYNVPYYIGVLLAGPVAAIVGVVMMLPALRLQGLYLAFATTALAELLHWVFSHWESVTRGQAGIVLVKADFAWLGLTSAQGIYAVSLIVLILVFLFVRKVMAGRVGRALMSIRDSEIAAVSLGVGLTQYKMLAYAFSAFIAGIAGGLFALLINLVTPESFATQLIVVNFAMVVLGGLGSLWGSLIGSALLIALNEVLRSYPQFQEMIFGLLLLLTMMFFQGGFISIVRKWVPGWNEPLHMR